MEYIYILALTNIHSQELNFEQEWIAVMGY